MMEMLLKSSIVLVAMLLAANKHTHMLCIWQEEEEVHTQCLFNSEPSSNRIFLMQLLRPFTTSIIKT